MIYLVFGLMFYWLIGLGVVTAFDAYANVEFPGLWIDATRKVGWILLPPLWPALVAALLMARVIR